MSNGIKRRQFLKATGLATAGATVAASGAAVLAPAGTAQAATPSPAHVTATLVQLSRGIFPHDTFPDSYYAEAVAALEANARNDPALAAQLQAGVTVLDDAFPDKFVDLSAGNQARVIARIQDTALFGTVRSHLVVGLYNQHLVWRDLGYEGPSFAKGGYVNRGFDDVNWLPKP